jgi:hypothetical protein
MVKDMATTAAECVRKPRSTSIWVPELGKYVCPDSPDSEEELAAAEQALSGRELKADIAAGPTISSQFKLVFLTAAGGTLLFVLICVALTLAAGKEPHPLLEKVVMSLFDLAKIGFDAVVGLLGAKHL